MDASSVLGGIAIGRDTSGNFRLSPAGLAVRFGDRWVVNENGQLVEMSRVLRLRVSKTLWFESRVRELPQVTSLFFPTIRSMCFSCRTSIRTGTFTA